MIKSENLFVKENGLKIKKNTDTKRNDGKVCKNHKKIRNSKPYTNLRRKKMHE